MNAQDLADQLVTVEYFNGVLCIWAYGAQARVDELKRDFGDQSRDAQSLHPAVRRGTQLGSRKDGASTAIRGSSRVRAHGGGLGIVD